jgi:aminoglycoside phosphotransferase (APT) family kinase protein
LTGLVDGERYLHGDPLMDLVSLALFRRIEDEPSHPALKGYADARGAPLVLDAPARRRLTLYRTHLYLLMIVEMPSRGNRPDPRSPWYRRLAGLLDEQLTDLGRDVPRW